MHPPGEYVFPVFTSCTHTTTIEMPSIVNPKFNPAHPVACPTIHTASDNTVVLEVDNLLADWPTYLIRYTPQQPGETVVRHFDNRCHYINNDIA